MINFISVFISFHLRPRFLTVVSDDSANCQNACADTATLELYPNLFHILILFYPKSLLIMLLPFADNKFRL